MSRSHGASDGQRVFIALRPPKEVRDQLAGWLRTAAIGAETRPVPSRNMHLTLCFLGARQPAEIAAAEAVMAEVPDLPGRLQTGAPVWLPRRKPRALAVEVHEQDGGLAKVQAGLAEALSAAIGWEEPRRFRPHITVARFGRTANPRRDTLPATPALEFEPDRLVLYRSLLSPEGAEYEEIASVALR